MRHGAGLERGSSISSLAHRSSDRLGGESALIGFSMRLKKSSPPGRRGFYCMRGPPKFSQFAWPPPLHKTLLAGKTPLTGPCETALRRGNSPRWAHAPYQSLTKGIYHEQHDTEPELRPDTPPPLFQARGDRHVDRRDRRRYRHQSLRA